MTDSSNTFARCFKDTPTTLGTNDYSRKLHPLEQFFTGTEYYTTPVVETSPVVPSGPRPLETPNTDHT